MLRKLLKMRAKMRRVSKSYRREMLADGGFTAEACKLRNIRAVLFDQMRARAEAGERLEVL